MLDVADLALLGGHVALDLVNTIEDRDSAVPDDVLRTPQDLDRWAERVGVLPGKTVRRLVTREELALTVRFREELHSVLRAWVMHTPAPQAALRGVGETIGEAQQARCLTSGPDALRWEWAEQSPSLIRYGVALAAAQLLTDETLMAHTRLCAGEQCGWFYLDQTKNHSRRWCSMRGCGTRAKARRRAQKKA